ncbi:MAG TPA: 1-aminocyclopropane-1-carboxylate deaminase/D-cysteine desulfhydrase, partial [Epsilonproteobacteria bacterium]|nr:1-aminocyclopropane-1-carboxylate deaminase/D-cysteine desulfhydrase [Campylobacterota bacterium]
MSYGSAQSNAMYSLSVLAKMRGWEFEYYVDHIAGYLQENPHGNYLGAVINGMNVIVGRSVPTPTDEVLFIEEGGRQQEAEFGIRLLAEEIIAWQKTEEIEALNVFLPSGTGTTALYLQKALISSVGVGALRPTVFTTPCVGGAAYLKKQFLMLEADVSLH